MKTLQETFDELLIHLRALGGKKITSSEGKNIYKTPNGEAACPVGHLIPIEKYESYMEGKTTNSYAIKNILVSEGYNVFLCDMFQTIHDVFHPCSWEDTLSLLAEGIGLNYFPPEGHELREGMDVLHFRNIIEYSPEQMKALHIRARVESAITDKNQVLNKARYSKETS